MNKKLTISFVFMVLCLFATAQNSYSGSGIPSVTISQVCGFSLTQNNSYNFNFTTITQIKNGITSTNMNNFAVKSNVPWNMLVKASTPTFSATGTFSSSNMPASVLRLTTSLQTVTLSTTDQVLYSGIAGDATATGNTFNMSMYANPGFYYGPGSYTINVIYTLTAQ